MATYSKQHLSGSPDDGLTPPHPTGRVIPIAATASPGTLLHTAIPGASAFDEVYLYASNITALAATLTIQWGGVDPTADVVAQAVVIPPNSAPFPIVIGLSLNAGLEIRAFSDTADAINISGFVHRIQ